MCVCFCFVLCFAVVVKVMVHVIRSSAGISAVSASKCPFRSSDGCQRSLTVCCHEFRDEVL